MVTQTSVTAVRILIHLSREASGEAVSLKQVAEALGESPTYLVKIARHLVRAGILRAHRGKMGGVVLTRATEKITLLAVVEACQGMVHGNFCQDAPDLSKTCAMHQAGAELHNAIVGVLTSWTLADFLKQPCPANELQGKVHCLFEGGRPGLLPSPRKGRR